MGLFFVKYSNNRHWLFYLHLLTKARDISRQVRECAVFSAVSNSTWSVKLVVAG